MDNVKIHVLDQDGNGACSRFSVDNNPSNYDILVSCILNCYNKYNIQAAFIGLESISVYNWHIKYYLADHASLKLFNLFVTTHYANTLRLLKSLLSVYLMTRLMLLLLLKN